MHTVAKTLGILTLTCSISSGQIINGGASDNDSGSTLPAGIIVMVTSGTCPAGFGEVTALNGKFLQGTLAANGDVGGTGGNATVTPTGTVSQPSLTMNAYTPAGSVAAPMFTGTQGTVPAQTFTGSAGTVPAQTFTGSSSTSGGTSGGTPAGTVSQPTFTGSALATHAHELPFQIPSTTTTRQLASATFGTGTSRAATAVSATGTANTTSAAVALSQAISAGTPAGTVSQPTFTGSALATHTHTLTATGTNGTVSFTPSGTNATALFTPAGTNSAPAFTGTQATLTGSVSQPSLSMNAIDPKPQYVKVIFCTKQ